MSYRITPGRFENKPDVKDCGKDQEETMNKISYFLKSFLGITFFFGFMFAAAGKLNYPQGWLYYSLSIFGLLLNILAIQSNEQLMNERARPGVNAKAWDKKILGVSGILTILSYIVAGLDSGRFHWSPDLGIAIPLAGIVLVLIGQVIFMIAKFQNNFFSSVARIQEERKHTVCNRGLYQVVRHPGYLGMIISWLGFPFVTGSIFSSIPVAMAIILLIVRTVLEDKMLHWELNGYAEYSRETKYKLLPFIW